MKAVLQRVISASVTIEGKVVGEIGQGLLVLLGVHTTDTATEASYLSEKSVNLRIFEDEEGKMNRSLLDVGGEMLVVPNFTLYAVSKKGHRPSYTEAARPDTADPLFQFFASHVCEMGVSKVEKGIFGGDMKVSLVNDGPVTIILGTAEIMPQK